MYIKLPNMKTNVINYLLLLVMLVILAGCGSIHSHQWTEANYQSPSTCSICGETRGLKLPADFEEHAISANLTTGQEKVYHSICSLEDEKTDGTAVVTDYHVIDADETHPAKTGYQWQIVTMKVTFGDELSNKYGFKYNYLTTNFYDIETFEQSYTHTENTTHVFTVNYNGKDHTDCECYIDVVTGEWLKADDIYQKTVTITWNILVPAGYDGMVVGLRNSGIDTEGKYFIYEYYSADDFLLFRLGA